MKKMLSILLGMVMVISLSVPALAVTSDTFNEDDLRMGDGTWPEEVQAVSDEEVEIPLSETLDDSDLRIETGTRVESGTSSQLEEPGNVVLTNISKGDIGFKVSNVLVNEGDTETYEVTVDHSVYPEFSVYAYTSCGAPGYTSISIAGAGGGSINVRASDPSTYQNLIKPRDYKDISNSSGEVKTYTITAKAMTDDAGYTISVGAKNDLATHFGGPQNAISAGKTLQLVNSMSQFFSDYTELLNGEGDWFRYTPENAATYVGNYIFGEHQTAFRIYDAETLTPLFDSDISKDRYLYVDKFTTRTILQNCFMLERGKEYLICNYTPTGITPEGDYVLYRTYIGLPSVSSEEYSYRTTQSYTVSANKKTTFYIDVAGQPDTYRCDYNTEIRFCVSRYTQNVTITSCKITAPNGKVFDTKYGRTQIKEYPDLVNFLNNNQNIPINGRWKVEILTSKTMSDMHFSIGNYVLRLDRTTPPKVTT